MAASEYVYTLTDISAVVAREDVDGADRRVMIVNTRGCGADSRILFDMSPAIARQLATRLRRYADFLEPPRPKRKARS